MPKVDPFCQTPPSLGNQYDDDIALRRTLARLLPADVLTSIEPELREMGEVAVDLYRYSLETRLEEPRLTTWDPWGRRIDRIELTSLWQRAARVAAEHGVVAAAYEDSHGPHARMHQFALAYLFSPSSDIYSCPLAMTDGAARTLLASGNHALIERAVPRLTSRDPSRLWTSGQWMTESTGGSDVGRSETLAVREGEGWRLHGRKWFTSAATSEIALTLARPEGNPAGGRGLALFYLECFRDDGSRLPEIIVHRLKEKLGTRKLPTAELTLEGMPATPVRGTDQGIRNIAPMLNITRTWNAVNAVAIMRRSIALARDYAARRQAFGAPLIDKPLHIDTLAGLQAELEGALQLTFHVVTLLGRSEAGELEDAEAAQLRLLTPLMKLTTAKQAVSVASEVLEAFGGAGYVEDTGLPTLLRDAQVLPIWEGTTNVLSLDALRAVAKGPALAALVATLEQRHAGLQDPALAEVGARARDAAHHAAAWLGEANAEGLEAGARRFAWTLGRATALVLLCEQAEWELRAHGDRRARAAALRFARAPLDVIGDAEESGLLSGA